MWAKKKVRTLVRILWTLWALRLSMKEVSQAQFRNQMVRWQIEESVCECGRHTTVVRSIYARTQVHST